MAIAHFQTDFSQSAIERETGVIRGVSVMELGHVARFRGQKEDGSFVKKQITITDAQISALMSHAGNRAIPVHLTHAHSTDKQDGLASKAGALKAFRKNETGSLVADLHLVPGPMRDLALWHAENDPENMMISAVYSFLPDDPNCIPQDFQAADLVEKGAGVTALLAEDTMPDPLDFTALIAALKDPATGPALAAAIKAAIKAAEPDEPEDTSAVEADAGVTAADSAESDTKLSATMACISRINRANKRKLETVTAQFESAKADILVAAEAQLTAALGTIKLPSVKKEVETALFGMDRVKASIKAQLTTQKN